MSDQVSLPQTASVSPKLIAANVALLGVLAALTIAGMQSPAGAQSGLPRGRGDYTMLSGRYQGGNSNAVYVIDGANQEVLALTWNRTKIEFEPVGVRSMLADGQRQAPPR